MSNTALKWQGKRWSMILWPLPADPATRQTLAFHEFFHRIQPELGFGNLAEADNQHLDQEAGRVWLQLELAALQAAVRAPAASAARRAHVHHALLFRQYRRSQYPTAATNENLFELNEGLAEYTGFLVAARPAAGRAAYLASAIDTFYRNPTFVRSFAYVTIPAYGYLVQPQQPKWHRTVRATTDLTALFARAFAYTAPTLASLSAAARRTAQQYGLSTIQAAEARREAAHQLRVAGYRQKFLASPCLTITLLKMNISFDPRNLEPLGTAGTVYPHMELSDSWGTLSVTNGALLSASWGSVVVPAPTTIAGPQVLGEGYKLQLNPGWVIEKAVAGSYTLRKQP